MDYNYNDYEKDIDQMKDDCESMVSYHVILKFEDGCMVDGILESVDDEYVTVLIGEEIEEEEFDSNGKRHYGRPRRRYRRYRRRRRFPIRRLRRLLYYNYPYYPY